MANRITRQELLLLLEELDRGEADRDQVEELVAALELTITDAEALQILEDDELTTEEVADQLVGYSERNA